MSSLGIESLPDEVLEYIIYQLYPYNDLNQCRLVSWRWYYAVKNVLLQKSFQLCRGIADFRMCWHAYSPGSSGSSGGRPEQDGRIAARFSHSAVVHGHSMFIFGGGTFEATCFNDLWRFDLTTRTYVRPLSTGRYPPPKSCATLVSHGHKLILFGGWRHTNTNSWYQRDCVLYNQLHVYDVPENKWTLVSGTQSDQMDEREEGDPNMPPTLARHSATVCNNEMIVFGGIQRYAAAMTYSNEVWRLDLTTYRWTRQKVTQGPQPQPRYGQAQVQLDEHNILIVGGCGGPNNIFRDAWLLKRPSEAEGSHKPWSWRPVAVKGTTRGGPSPTGHIWCNPVCQVGDKLVVLGPTRATDFQIVRETSQAFVNPPRHEHRPPSPPLLERRDAVAPQPPPGEHHQMVREFNQRAEEERQRLDVEHENIMMRMRRFRRRQPGDVGPAVVPNVNVNMPWGRRSAAVRLAAFQDTNNNGHPGPQERMSPRQQEAHQLLVRGVQQRMNEHQGVLPPARVQQEVVKRINRSKLLAMHVCDLSGVLRGEEEPVLAWQDPPENLGCFEGAPEKLILYSLVLGKGELIMFGGLVKNMNSESPADVSKVSNGLYFLSVPNRVI